MKLNIKNLRLTGGQEDLEVNKIINFLKKTYKAAGDKNAVIAVSGGIDSALSLTLLTKALGKEKITPVFLPYDKQSITDSQLVTKFNNFANKNIININIKKLVDIAQLSCHPALVAGSKQNQDSGTGSGMTINSKVRLGNLMVRSRMLLLYDIAKQKNALVCGTENKSEKYLGYFTRFGDEASDVEPIVHLYKTQVWQLAKYLNLPGKIINKAPSAGLWPDQTDEQELGFSYSQADQILYYLINQKKSLAEILKLSDLPANLIRKILNRVESMVFKQQVPYHL